MGRLVRLPRQASQSREGIGTTGDAAPLLIQPDDYLLRLAKYVPAEVIAFSILINAILDQALRNGGPAAMMAGVPVMTIAIAALIVGTIMSPVYVWYVRQAGDAWVTHAWVSFLAFPVWSYALGAVAFTDYRDGNLAAILLASFTAASGLIKPLPLGPARAEDAEAIETQASPRGTRSAATAARRLVDVSAIPMPGP
jgi:hypothetical protein